MALTYNGVNIKVVSTQIPYNYTVPVVTTFTDYYYTHSEKLEITQSSVSNSDKATEFGNIVTSISTTTQATLNTDYDVSNRTITAWTDLTNVATNVNSGDEMYDGSLTTYICTVTTYIKSETL